MTKKIKYTENLYKKGVVFVKRYKKIVASALAMMLLSGGVFGTSYAVDGTKHVSVAQPKTNIIGDISIVREVNSASELEEVVKAEALPSTVIVNIDSGLNVLDKEGNGFSSVADVISSLNYQIIPTFNLADKATADALASTLKSLNFFDVCIMSEDADVVKYSKELLPAVRGVIDYTEKYKATKELSQSQLVEIRKTTMKNDAYIAVLPANLCNREAVQHLYDGRIPVWAELSDDATTKEKYEAILSGAIGVISDDTSSLMEISCDKLEEDTLTRNSLNVGHKGMPTKALENTIESGHAAVKAGADALEIDVYMTKDNKVVIMHDYKTGGTCDQDLVIADSTLAELKKLWVIQNEDGTGKDFEPCRIPTLEEFFQEFQSSEVRFFIEFKGGGEEIVKAVRDLVNQYNMYDRCTAIAFDTGVMEDIRELWAEMPISYLTFTMPIDENNADASCASVMTEIGKYNATYSPSISTQGGIKGVRASLIRGVMINGWTYEKKSTYLVSYMNGESSITGDDASAVAKYPTSLVAKNLSDGMEVNKGEKITLNVEESLYNGKNKINSGLDCLVIEGDGVVLLNGKDITFNKTGEITFLIEYQHPITSINVPTVYSEVITVKVVGDEDVDNTTPEQGDERDDGQNQKQEDSNKEENKNVGTWDGIFKKVLLFGGITVISMAVILFVIYKKKKA